MDNYPTIEPAMSLSRLTMQAVGSPLCGLAALCAIATIWTYPIGSIRVSLMGASMPVPAIFMALATVAVLISRPNEVFFGITHKDLRAMVLSIFFLGCAYLVSCLWAEGIDGIRIASSSWVFLLYIFMAPFVIISLSFLDLRLIRSLLFLAVSIAVAIGYYRFLTGSGGVMTEHLLGYWGIRYEPSTRNADVLYPIVMLVLAFVGFLQTTGRWLKGFYFMAFLAASIAVLLSFSRGGWIAAFIAFSYLAYRKSVSSRRGFYKRVLKWSALIIAVLFAFAVLTPNRYQDKLALRARSITQLTDGRNNSNLARLYILEAGAAAIVMHPIGSGAGLFRTEVKVPNLERIEIGNAENIWVTAGVEAGWIGLLSLVMLTIFLWKRCLENVYAAGINLELLRGLSMAIFLYLLFNNEVNNLFLWVLIPILVRASANVREWNPNEYRSSSAFL